MISIKNFQTFSEQKKFMESLDLDSIIYVISDLQSRADLQDQFLKKVPLISDFHLQREKDFWSYLLSLNKKQKKILSPIASQVFFEYQLKSQQGFSFSKEYCLLVYQTFVNLFPLLQFDQMNRDILNDWWGEHPESFVSIGALFSLCQLMMDKCEQENFIPEEVALFNLKHQFRDVRLSFPLYIDLGLRLTHGALEALEELSIQNDIIILLPSLKYLAERKKDSLPYLKLIEKYDHEEILTQLKQSKKNNLRLAEEISLSLMSFKTTLLELEEIAVQVKELQKENIPLEEIALLCPNLKSLWPGLKRVLDRHFLPYQRATSEPLMGFKSIQRWLAAMKIEANQCEYSDLVSFEMNEDPHFTYNELKKKMSGAPPSQIIKRYEKDFSYKNKKEKIEDFFNSENFIEFASALTEDILFGEEIESIKNILIQIKKEVPKDFKISLSSWLSLIEKQLKSTHFYEKKNQKGLLIRDLSECQKVDFSYGFILGLSDSNGGLTESNSSLSLSTIESFSRELGVFLEVPLYQKYESLVFETLVHRPQVEWKLSGSYESLLGESSELFRFWTEQALENSYSLQTRTEGRIETSYCSSLTRKENSSIPLDSLLKNEKKQKNQRELIFSGSFSASTLQRYVQCPFIFKAEKCFQLKEEPHWGIEWTSLNKGTLIHSLYERLLSEPFNIKTQEDHQKLIETLFEEVASPYIHPYYLDLSKKNFLQKAKLFLKIENENQLLYPKRKFFRGEVSIKSFWDLKNHRFVLKKDQLRKNDFVSFKGSIDRIDEAEDGYILYDYKLKEGSLKDIKYWFRDHTYQLLIYSLAVEDGVAEGIPGNRPIYGAFYYFDENLKSNKGFKLSPLSEKMIDPKLKCGLSRDEILQFYSQMRFKISEWIQKIQKGVFEPTPQNPQNCMSCQWRFLCRTY